MKFSFFDHIPEEHVLTTSRGGRQWPRKWSVFNRAQHLHKVYENLVAKARALGRPDGFVHAHRVVQKTLPEKWPHVKDLTEDQLLQYYGRRANYLKAWYIGKAQKILDDAGIPLLDDVDELRRLIAAGSDDLDNIGYAFNGNGTHTWETTQAVYRALKEASDEAIQLGYSPGTKEYKDAIKEALQGLGQILGNGDKLF